jgi:hypothetical protein
MEVGGQHATKPPVIRKGTHATCVQPTQLFRLPEECIKASSSSSSLKEYVEYLLDISFRINCFIE